MITVAVGLTDTDVCPECGGRLSHSALEGWTKGDVLECPEGSRYVTDPADLPAALAGEDEGTR